MNTRVVRGVAVLVAVLALLVPATTQAGFELLPGKAVQKRESNQGRSIELAKEPSLGVEAAQKKVISASQYNE